MNRAEENNETINNQTASSSEISIPTSTPQVTLKEEPLVQFFGRRKIYTSLKKEELTADNILKILPSVLRIHDKNAAEIDYLWRYYKGEQPILHKIKKVRPDINNKILLNHAFEFVEFKKSCDFGEPVQYVQKGEKDSEKVNPQISLLNKFMEAEDKSTLDLQLSEWQCIGGTAFRWVDTDSPDDEDEAPFEISIPDPRRTFAVFSSDVKEKQLFSGTFSWFESDNAFEGSLYPNEFSSGRYRIITIYTDDYCMKIKETPEHTLATIKQSLTIGEKTEDVDMYPLIPKGQRIIEYPLNSARLGIIELVMSILNAINKTKSDDLDGIDQFVQSLLVFINQDVSVEDVRKLEEAGAIAVASQDPNKPADVKLLTQQILHSETKIVTDDLYDKAKSILGQPKLNEKASGGDTGQARQLGEGWTTSHQRAKTDDLNFKQPERKFLKLILKICKEDSRKDVDKITDLKISDIDIKIPRDKSDNMLTKAETLKMLIEAGVSPDVAYTVVALFSDPQDVYDRSVKYHGKDFWKKEGTNSVANIVDNSPDNSKEVNSVNLSNKLPSHKDK